jgi:prophage antirepressor-like protein
MQVIPFEYESNQVRVIQDENGEPWWVASDVCVVLELANTTEAIRSLDDDEKSTLRISEGGPERNIINESGLYRLLARSNKERARKFQRWLFHDVLPSIRKTGRYEIQGMSELDLIIRSAEMLKDINARVHTLEAKVHQNSGQTGYWTITAWCKLVGLNISLDEAMQRGREASRISKDWEAGIGKVHDERFGVVNSYREDVLEEVFGITGESKCA